MFNLIEILFSFVVILVSLFLIGIKIFAKFCSRDDKTIKRAFIVVLGDIGRSPRMNYHCLSLTKLGYHVSLIGYNETKQMEEIENNSNVKIVPLSVYPKYLQIGPQIFQYALKAIFLTLSLIYSLYKASESIPRFVLVQNPPSIPTLVIVYFYSLLTKAKFIIDWHNYGYSILALKSGPTSSLVKICQKFELFFGQKSDLNFCVTQAMRNDLAKHNIKAITAYDKAHERFKKNLSLNEKHQFYLKLIRTYNLECLKPTDSDEATIFTELDAKSKVVTLKSSRPVLMVSSSSWTEDEDFQILVDAFDDYQNKLNQNDEFKLPNLVCILTGKGPLKQYYQDKFNEKNYKNIKINFVWLEANDYPTLLSSCDIGLCFHMSSSNLDLPMKVVDMFGAGLPPLCLKFSCISELVKSNENGLLFSNSQELSQHFVKLFADFNTNRNQNEEDLLAKFRKNIDKFTNWNEEWNEKVKPLLQTI